MPYFESCRDVTQRVTIPIVYLRKSGPGEFTVVDTGKTEDVFHTNEYCAEGNSRESAEKGLAKLISGKTNIVWLTKTVTHKKDTFLESLARSFGTGHKKL